MMPFALEIIIWTATVTLRTEVLQNTSCEIGYSFYNYKGSKGDHIETYLGMTKHISSLKVYIETSSLSLNYFY